jgi:hypothetical protein
MCEHPFGFHEPLAETSTRTSRKIFTYLRSINIHLAGECSGRCIEFKRGAVPFAQKHESAIFDEVDKHLSRVP